VLVAVDGLVYYLLFVSCYFCFLLFGLYFIGLSSVFQEVRDYAWVGNCHFVVSCYSCSLVVVTLEGDQQRRGLFC